MKITVKGLFKKFGPVRAVDNFNAVFESGRLISLLGPSGCGKTTMLLMLAGIVEPSGGSIFFDEKDITRTPAEKRGVGLVFQNYALYPHMTVLDNICFPLEIRRISKKERLRRAGELAAFVRIEDYLARKPGELSGGQQQRVAIARSLAKDPAVLLMDEPLSNLDARLRLEMREDIRRIQREAGITVIFVTHDQEEAMSISDKILLMENGRQMQYDVPHVLYNQPANRFAAKFLGLPPINELPGFCREGCFYLEDRSPLGPFPWAGKFSPDTELVLSIRPESFVFPQPRENRLPEGEGPAPRGVLKEIYSTGKEDLAVFSVGSRNIRAFLPAGYAPGPGTAIHFLLRDRGVFLYNRKTGERLL
jgi:multiple sugar transport system ATP-binding protein